MNSLLSREPLGRMITLDSLTGYLLPSNAASLLTLPVINQPPLRTRGNGPSSTTWRPRGSQHREGGLPQEMPLVLPTAWSWALGEMEDLAFQFNKNPRAAPPPPASPPRLWHFPQRRWYTRSEGDHLSLDGDRNRDIFLRYDQVSHFRKKY